jgi:transposase-like protein
MTEIWGLRHDHFSLTPRGPAPCIPAQLLDNPSRLLVPGGEGTLLEIGGDQLTLLAPAAARSSASINQKYPNVTERANEPTAMVNGRERNVSDDAQGADGLPDTSGNVRWTARRKMAVLRAVTAGEISAEEIARRYAISPEELDTWSHEYAERGLRGLLQKELETRRRNSSGGDRRSRLVPAPAPYPASS